MKQLLQRTWLKRGWLAHLLWPVAAIYGLLVRLRLSLYRSGLLPSERFSVPVIVVGNIVAGGAGKTPLVIELVRHLKARGLSVGVVSRGYGRFGHACIEVNAETPVIQSGDEPALIKNATDAPVFVAPRRTEALRALLAAYPATKVVVCDDGLQHYALQRDIEIAVFDDCGIGNGWLLPAGPLREPWPERSQQGIDLILHTGLKPAFAGFTSSRRLADYAVAADGSRVDLAALRCRPLVALAGIANPNAFFAMLHASGLILEKTLSLPDHHNFVGTDFAAFAGHTILCTEKDAVKLFAMPALARLCILAVPLEFLPEAAFFSALDTLLAPRLSQLPSSHGHQIT